jgi:hypothetical protein
MSQTHPHNYKAFAALSRFFTTTRTAQTTSLALIPHIQEFGVTGGYNVASAFVHGAI